MKTERMKNLPEHTVKTTSHLILWTFFIISLYIIVTTAYGFYIQGFAFLDGIVTLSVGGFFAFFMGYFGWRLAESMEGWLTQK